MEEFSIYLNGITTVKPDGKITILDLVFKLKDPSYKEIIEKIRSLQHNDPKELKNLRNNLKKKLSYVTPAGLFKIRNKKNIYKQSGYAPIDIDDIDPYETKELLKSDPFINLMFISPSGNGLKIIITIPKGIQDYPYRVIAFYTYLKNRYGIKNTSLDKSTHDISRACYISYDSEPYYNENAEEFKDIEMDESLNIKDTSRSAFEYRQIIKLLFAGRDKEYIFNEMEIYSKWKESPDAYKEYTYEKAVDYVENTAKLSPEEKKSIIPELAKITMEHNKIVTLQADSNSEIWIYRDGIYVPNGRTYIEIFLGNILKDFYDMAIVTKVVDIIKKDTYMPADKFFTEENPRYVCIENGILDIIEKKLYEFSDEFKFFNKLPIKFDKTKTCETTINHYNTILNPEDIPLMQEIYGYLLYREYKFQRAFIFSGDGGNGKGKSLNQMKHFLGEYNVVNISLQIFEKDSFMKSNMHKKLANLGADLGNSELKDTSTFRELTGEDLMTANRKYLEPVTFRNYAKMIFAVNTLPYISDDTEGFWRRWIHIPFNISFLYPNDYETLKNEGKLKSNHRIMDVNMESKLTNPDELSGVLNWALIGLERLMKNNTFSYNKTYEQTKKTMQERESSAILFMNRCLKRINDASQYETHENIYKNYLQFCFNHDNIKIEPDLKFRKILENHGISLERKRTAIGWELRWYFIKYTGE